ncbi:hypothetical protein [Acinetobacter soli]|uniref:hypothetical protein n=1 Tax=Acinetobacter soli TaxID=487316 RepID=UPI002FEF2EE6
MQLHTPKMPILKFKSGDKVVWQGNSSIDFLIIKKILPGSVTTIGEGPSANTEYGPNFYECEYVQNDVNKKKVLSESVLSFY